MSPTISGDRVMSFCVCAVVRQLTTMLIKTRINNTEVKHILVKLINAEI